MDPRPQGPPAEWLPDAAAAARALRAGQVVLMPTDTLPGLHARADDAAALARLAALKGRPADRPLVVIAGSLAQARRIAVIAPGRVAALAARCWPGPFSLVLPARAAAAAVTAGTGTVAVRVPDLPWLCEVARRARGPLASTSANASGEAPAPTLAAAAASFGGRVAVFAGAGEAVERGAASALVDVTTWPPRILRAGPLALPALPSDA